MISVLGHAKFELRLQHASRGVDCKWKCRSDRVSVPVGVDVYQVSLRENGQDIRNSYQPVTLKP